MRSDLPLIAIGGTLCDARIWSSVLEDRATIAIVAGKTVDGHMSGSGDMSAYVADLLQQLPPRFLLVGFSLGGLVALEMIAQAPDRIAGLALICAGFGAETEKGVIARRNDEMRAETAGIALHAEQDVWPRFCAKNVTKKTDYTEMAQAVGLDLYRRQNDLAISRKDCVDRLSRIDVPVLLVTGAEDRLCPPDRHEIAQQKIADVSVVVIEDAGHMIPFDKPGELSRHIYEWVTKIEDVTTPRVKNVKHSITAQTAT